MFAGLKPAAALLHREALQDSGGDHSSLLDGYGCIIDEPKYAMSIPLLNLNPSALIQTVLTAAEMEPSTRRKPVCATVRGQGGGKTRALEEIRRAILCTRPNVLPIAITFNHKSDCSFDSWGAVETPQLYYALSLVARMASSFYDIDFKDVMGILSMRLPAFTFPKHLELKNAEKLIRGFVVIMMEAMSAHNRTVDTFVLLIDEAVRMERKMQSMKSFQSQLDGDVQMTSVISAALLNEKLTFSPSDGEPHQPINAALLISSLQVSPVGKSPSSRNVEPIVLAESLDPHAILEKIWRPCFKHRSSLSKKEAHTLLLIAAMVNTLPRMVESVDTFFRTGNNSNVPIDEQLVSDLLIYLMEKTNSRYSGFTLPSPGLLYASIFGQKVMLEEQGVMEAIQDSIFTNSLDSFSPTSVIQPVVSILMLCAAASHSKLETSNMLTKELTDTYSSLVDQIIASTKNDVGRLLEVAGYHWLRFRLRLLSNMGLHHETNCGRLLGLDAAIAAGSLSYNLEALLSTPVINSAQRRISFHTMTKRSYGATGMRKVIDELEGLKYEADTIVIRPHPKEAFDLCLKVFRPDSSHPAINALTTTAPIPAVALAASSAPRPLYIFIDFKSATEPVSSSLRKKRKLPKGGKQYDHVRKMLQEAGLVEESGTSEEQFSTNFLYVYMCTHNISTFQEGNAVCMGRDDTLKFFGPLASLYQTGRSVLGVPGVKEEHIP